MPELMAMATAGFLVCWIMNGIAIYCLQRKYRSPSYLRLQKNLSLIQLYWSDNESRMVPFSGVSSAEAIRQDQRQSRRALLIMGAGASLVSWFGVFFMLILLVSLNVIAKSRLEIEIFKSALVGEHLSADQIRATVEKINAFEA